MCLRQSQEGQMSVGLEKVFPKYLFAIFGFCQFFGQFP